MTVNEKKLILEKYKIFADRLEVLRKEVADLRNRAASLSANVSGMPLSKADGTKIERALENIERSILRLINEESAVSQTIDRVITAIDGLSDVRERQIMSLKYIGEKSGDTYRRYKLWEIANRMGYSVDRIQQLHSRALKKIKL